MYIALACRRNTCDGGTVALFHNKERYVGFSVWGLGRNEENGCVPQPQEKPKGRKLWLDSHLGTLMRHGRVQKHESRAPTWKHPSRKIRTRHCSRHMPRSCILHSRLIISRCHLLPSSLCSAVLCRVLVPFCGHLLLLPYELQQCHLQGRQHRPNRLRCVWGCAFGGGVGPTQHCEGAKCR